MQTKPDRKKIVKQICKAAQKYKQNLVGKTFLYIFNNNYIEVMFKTKDFKHLTGVESTLSAQDFYKNANHKNLQPNQIYFTSRHPYVLAARKLQHLNDISNLAMNESFMLKDITTQTETYKFGTTDLNFSLCFNKEKDSSGVERGNCFIAKSLRDEDCFSKSSDVYTVTHIFSRSNTEKKYNQALYIEPNHTIDELPLETKNMISDELLNQSTKTSQSPMHDIVDNLNTISSDAVLSNPKALVDLYNLSKTERPTTNIIYQICNENNLQFSSFDAFVNRKPELQTAYDKHTGVINDLTFDPTYERLESFIDPFKNKSQEPLVWSIEKCIWERIPGGPPSNNDSKDEITETIDNKPDTPTEELLNDSSNNSSALNTSSDNDITNDTPSNNVKPVILSRFNRAFSELPTFDTNIQDHEKSLI